MILLALLSLLLLLGLIQHIKLLRFWVDKCFKLEAENKKLKTTYNKYQKEIDRINFRLKQNFRYKRYYNLKIKPKRNPYV